jgi:thioesterase domain-containing protein/acyl carrier protein
MIPAHIVVLDTLPTNAHGKVALDLLPAWDDEAPARGTREPAGGVMAGPPPSDPAGAAIAAVTRLAEQILDTGFPIHPDHDFLVDLGGSSLALFQLLTAIEREFDCRIEIGQILEDTSIEGLARLARRAGRAGRRPGGPSHLSVHEGGTKRPVYMIHAYLGTVLRYRQLGGHLSHDRPLVGIQVQAFDSGSQPTRTSVDQMAAEAVDQIRALQPTGPYVVGGHSAGGLVAYETARLLVAEGERVPLVILLDSPLPRSPLHYLWAEAVLNWPDFRSASPAQRRHHLATIVSGHQGHGSTPASDRVGATISRSHRASNVAVRHYSPGLYRGAMAVLHTRQGTLMALGKEDLGWSAVARGPVTSIAIPGQHNTIFDVPQLGVIGESLDRLLDDIDDHPRLYGLTPRAAPAIPS